MEKLTNFFFSVGSYHFRGMILLGRSELIMSLQVVERINEVRNGNFQTSTVQLESLFHRQTGSQSVRSLVELDRPRLFPRTDHKHGYV